MPTLVKQLIESGCAVVILTFDDDPNTARQYRDLGAKVINTSLSAAEAAMEIGQACLEAIQSASQASA